MRRARAAVVLASVAAALAVATAVGRPARPAAAAPPARFRLEAAVPASTVAFAAIAPLDDVRARLRATALGRLAARDDLAPALDDLARAATALVDRGATATGPTAVACTLVRDALARGARVAWALLSVDGDGTPRWAVACDPVDPAAAPAFVAALSAAADAGALTADGPGAWTASRDGHVAFAARADGPAVVFSNHLPWLAAVDLAAPAATGSLAETEAWRALAAGAGDPPPLVEAFVDAQAASAALPALDPGTSLRAWADAAGLGGVVALGYTLTTADDGFAERCVCRAPGEGVRLPLLLAGGGARRGLRAFAPATTLVHVEVRLPVATWIARAWDVVRRGPDEAAAAFEAALEGFRDATGVDAPRLLGTLGPAASLWVATSPQGGLLPDIGLAFEVADELALRALSDRAADEAAASATAAGKPSRHRTATYAGATMHWLERGEPGADALEAGAWAILDGVLLVASHVHGLRETLARRRAGEPSWASRGPPAAAPDAVVVVELDLGRVLAVAYDTAAPFAQGLPLERVPFLADVDRTRWPPARTLPATGPYVLTIAPTASGARIDAHGALPLLGGALACVVPSFAARAPAPPAPPVAPAPAPSSPPAATTAPTAEDPEARTARVLRDVAAALREYASLHGALPPRLDALREPGALLGAVPVDGWGRTLRWAPAAPGAGSGALTSAGEDGRFATADDRTVEVPAPPK